jgi:molybdopterin converting factor small subunit
MQITVQFFSQLRDVTGASELPVELPEESRVADLLAHLYRQCPALEKWDANLLIGAGVDFVERDHVLRANDQIALMPPVQGG